LDKIPWLILIVLLSVASAAAETYSCRDSQGKLHFADNPANLPEDCRGQEQKIEPGKVGNLNLVPAAPTPPQSGRAFEQTVYSAEKERQQKQQQTRNLQLRAEQLAKKYQEAVRAKRGAVRSWSYDSREQINKADQQIKEARAGKQQLLQELESLKIPSAEEKKIRQELKAIEEE